MSGIKGGAIDNTEFITTTIRYLVLFLLLIITFYYMYYPNLQYMCFMILLVLVILGTTFVIRDLALTPEIWKSMARIENYSILTNNSTLLTIFLFAIGFSILFKIISVTLMVTVFNYGRKQLSANETTKKLTYDNSMTLKSYKSLCIGGIIMTLALLSIIFITYSSPEVRVVLKNVIAILLTIGILVSSSYEMIYASKFFDIFKMNGLLYEVGNSLE